MLYIYLNGFGKSEAFTVEVVQVLVVLLLMTIGRILLLQFMR